MTRDRLVQRIDQLLQKGADVLATRHRTDQYTEYVDVGKIKGFRSAALSFVERVYGISHSHYRELDKTTTGFGPLDVEMGIEILQSIRDEIAGDWLFTLRGMITAEVFADFIDMARFLLENGYKDPAAVIAGSVLEEHLRELCQKNGVESDTVSDSGGKPKKADRLNAELAAANVYTKLDQKAVTMWLDLRNKAAHGKYGEYTHEQVRNMVAGVTEFMARVPG